MKKRTIIAQKINDDNTGFVINRGIEEIKLFKKLKDNGFEITNIDSLTNEEMTQLLRHVCTDGIIRGVYLIENHYNRDQKPNIDPIKKAIEKEMESKGITIISHSNWEPSFDYNQAIDVINQRNYLTVLCENIEDKKKHLFYVNNKTKELEEKIKEQILYLEQYQSLESKYNNLKNEVERLEERYRKGKIICEEQLKNAKNNWPIELKNLEKKIEDKEIYYQKLLIEEKAKEKDIEKIKRIFDQYNEKINFVLDIYNKK